MQTNRTGLAQVCRLNDSSTGNLHKHIAFCNPPLNKSKIMEKFGAGCTYSHKGFQWLLMHWVVCKNRPYTIIDDEELIEVFESLHGLPIVPCMNTLTGDIKLTHGM